MGSETGVNSSKQLNYSFEEELQFPLKPKPLELKKNYDLRQSYSLSSLEKAFPGDATLEEVSLILNTSEPSGLYHSSLISDISDTATDFTIKQTPNGTNETVLSKYQDTRISERSKTVLPKSDYVTRTPDTNKTVSVSRESAAKKRYSDLSLIISKKLNKCINNIFNKSQVASRYSLDKRDVSINTPGKGQCMNCSCHLPQDNKPEPDSTNMIDLYPQNRNLSSESNDSNICNKKFYLSNVSSSFDSTNSDRSDNVFDKGFVTSNEQSSNPSSCDASFSNNSVLNKGFMNRRSGSLTRTSLPSSALNKANYSVQQATKKEDPLPSESFMEKIFLEAIILKELVYIDDDEIAENLSTLKPVWDNSSDSEDELDKEHENKISVTKKYFPDVPPLSLDVVCSLSLKSNISNRKEPLEPHLPVVAPPLQLDKILPSKFREKRETIKPNVPKRNVPMKAMIPISKMITKIKGKGSSSKSPPPSSSRPALAARSTPLLNEKDKKKKPAYIPDTQSGSSVKRSFLPSPRQYPTTSGGSPFGSNCLKRSPVSSFPTSQYSKQLNSVENRPLTSTPVQNVKKMFSSLSPVDMKMALGPRPSNINTSYSGSKSYNSNYSKSGHRKSKSFGSFSSTTEAVASQAVSSHLSQSKNARDKENRHPSF